MYQIFTNYDGSEMVVRSDGAWIPVDSANTDYQQYLEWVAEGNTPEPWQPNEPQEVV